MTTPEQIQEIKQRTDMVDLVGQYVQLKKAGINYKGLCPFHHERSPSFMVSPERQSFKCFGCNKGGDCFEFIQEIEGMEFVDALELLAERSGVMIQKRTKGEHKPSSQVSSNQNPEIPETPSAKSRAFAINALSASIFHKILLEHPSAKEAREYLAKRHLSLETIKQWRIGYAPRQKVLLEMLIKRGFTAKEIEAAGKPTMFYDRIMFPIIDIMGKTLGFTGRILGQGEPKYLNTPETLIFHKSRILFGLDKARPAIREKGRVIMAEGQMDVIGSFQAGVQNLVATSGTALTQDHLRILGRYGVDIVFAFDADTAGQKATWKAIDMAMADGLPIKVIPLPKPYKDIGDIVETKPGDWQKIADNPVPALEWQIESVMSRYRTAKIERKLSVDEKKAVARELIPVISKIPDVIEQSHYIQLLAKRLEVKEGVIQQAMARVGGAKNRNPREEKPETVVVPKVSLTTEATLLGLMETRPELRVGREELYKSLKKSYTQPINDLLFAISEQYRGTGTTELAEETQLLVSRLQEQERDQVKTDFATKIQLAEASGDRETVKRLLLELQTMLRS